MHTIFYLHVYFILGSISLQSFYVAPASQWPRPKISEDVLFHLECHFFFQSSDGSVNRCSNIFQGRNTVSTRGLF